MFCSVLGHNGSCTSQLLVPLDILPHTHSGSCTSLLLVTWDIITHAHNGSCTCWFQHLPPPLTPNTCGGVLPLEFPGFSPDNIPRTNKTKSGFEVPALRETPLLFLVVHLAVTQSWGNNCVTSPTSVCMGGQRLPLFKFHWLGRKSFSKNCE